MKALLMVACAFSLMACGGKTDSGGATVAPVEKTNTVAPVIVSDEKVEAHEQSIVEKEMRSTFVIARPWPVMTGNLADTEWGGDEGKPSGGFRYFSDGSFRSWMNASGAEGEAGWYKVEGDLVTLSIAHTWGYPMPESGKRELTFRILKESESVIYDMEMKSVSGTAVEWKLFDLAKKRKAGVSLIVDGIPVVTVASTGLLSKDAVFYGEPDIAAKKYDITVYTEDKTQKSGSTVPEWYYDDFKDVEVIAKTEDGAWYYVLLKVSYYEFGLSMKLEGTEKHSGTAWLPATSVIVK